MLEAGWSTIDEMMERLGGTATLVSGGQKAERGYLPGPKGVNSRMPLVANPSREADPGGDIGFRAPKTFDVLDWRANGRDPL